MSPKAPDDRIQRFKVDAENSKKGKGREAPRIYVTADGTKFKKPDLETYFAEYDETSESKTGCSCDSVSVVCTCNKVCTCNPQETCGCVGYTQEESGGGGSWCSCNKVCSCVPVH